MRIAPIPFSGVPGFGLYETRTGSGNFLFMSIFSYKGSLWGTWESTDSRAGLIEGICTPDGRALAVLSGNFGFSERILIRFLPFTSGMLVTGSLGTQKSGMSARFFPGQDTVRFHRSGTAGKKAGIFHSKAYAVSAGTIPSRIMAGPWRLPVRSEGQNSASTWSGIDFGTMFPGQLPSIYIRGVELSGPGEKPYSFAARGSASIRDYAVTRAAAASSRFWEKTAAFAPGDTWFSTWTEREVNRSGARLIEASLFRCFRSDTGAELHSSDILKPGCEVLLERLLTAAARRDAGVPEGGSLRDRGFFEETIPANGNPVPLRTGLGFGYDRYRIAPPQSGSFLFVLPWAQVKECLAPGFRPPEE